MGDKVIAYQNEADKTQLYGVRMTCGHVEQRRMRPSTAGVPWREGVTIDASTAACKACRDAKQASDAASWEARRQAAIKVGDKVRTGELGERWASRARGPLSGQIGTVELIKADVGFEGPGVLSALVGFDPPLPALDDFDGGQPVTGFWFLLSEITVQYPKAVSL